MNRTMQQRCTAKFSFAVIFSSMLGLAAKPWRVANAYSKVWHGRDGVSLALEMLRLDRRLKPLAGMILRAAAVVAWEGKVCTVYKFLPCTSMRRREREQSARRRTTAALSPRAARKLGSTRLPAVLDSSPERRQGDWWPRPRDHRM